MKNFPTAIDLFAGVGGLSLGAARAGLHVKAAVELDKEAIESHARNFPDAVHLRTDISSITGDRLLAESGLARGELDALIGGPPCQGFSIMGSRDVRDSRNNLFAHFFRLVAETRPAFFVAENVPGILSEQYQSLRESALTLIPTEYRLLKPITVHANLYGAATLRKRIFFVGYLPNRIASDLSEADFMPPDDIDPATVSRTLEGLPTRIDCRWQTEELGWRKAAPCRVKGLSDRIANAIPVGMGDPVSVDRYMTKGEVSGCLGTRHSDALKRRYGSLRYGEIDPATKSRRLDPDGFCPTLRAGTAADKGSFQAVRPIHFARPRVITPREAARLQGFPDWFVFHATKWHSFRQIGNSVSPIVAEKILQPLVDSVC